MLLAGEDAKTVGLVLPPDDAPVGTQVFGVRGAPMLPFAEFQKYKIQVGEEGTVVFLGREGEVRVPLKAGDVPLRVDKGFPAGTWVH